jgi:hypothetical protein
LEIVKNILFIIGTIISSGIILFESYLRFIAHNSNERKLRREEKKIKVEIELLYIKLSEKKGENK